VGSTLDPATAAAANGTLATAAATVATAAWAGKFADAVTALRSDAWSAQLAPLAAATAEAVVSNRAAALERVFTAITTTSAASMLGVAPDAVAALLMSRGWTASADGAEWTAPPAGAGRSATGGAGESKGEGLGLAAEERLLQHLVGVVASLERS